MVNAAEIRNKIANITKIYSLYTLLATWWHVKNINVKRWQYSAEHWYL